MSVPRMKRLIERGEFEKRLADFGTQVVKSFRTFEEGFNKALAERDARIAGLEAQLSNMRGEP